MNNRELRQLFELEAGPPAMDPYSAEPWSRPEPILESTDEPEERVAPAPAAVPLALPLLRPLRHRQPQLGTLARDLWERLPRLTWWPCLTAASRCVAGIVRVRIRGRRKC